MKISMVATLVCFAHTTWAETTADQLYNSVVASDYGDAVSIAKELQETNPLVLQQAISHLQLDHFRSTVEFSYQLWNTGAKEIVTDNFPAQYRLLFNDGAVRITNKESGPAVILAAPTRDSDSGPEITQLSDNISPRSNWKFNPIWESNRLYFKIWNIDTNQYLKFDETVADGKHVLKESETANTDEYEWYLVPKKDDPTSESSFTIINRRYNEPIEFESEISNAVPFRKTSKNKKVYSSWNFESE